MLSNDCRMLSYDNIPDDTKYIQVSLKHDSTALGLLFVPTGREYWIHLWEIGLQNPLGIGNDLLHLS